MNDGCEKPHYIKSHICVVKTLNAEFDLYDCGRTQTTRSDIDSGSQTPTTRYDMDEKVGAIFRYLRELRS